MTLRPGTRVRFHGGYSSQNPVCPICKFQCVYIVSGVITERYTVWEPRSQQFLPHPDLWVAKLDTDAEGRYGGYTVGYNEQFEIAS